MIERELAKYLLDDHLDVQSEEVVVYEALVASAHAEIDDRLNPLKTWPHASIFLSCSLDFLDEVVHQKPMMSGASCDLFLGDVMVYQLAPERR